MGSDQSVIPPPPDGSAIVPTAASSSGIPPPPDGSGVVPVGGSTSGPVSRFVGSLAKTVNPVTGIKGLAHMVAHPIDTYNADVAARQQIGHEATADVRSDNFLTNLGGVAKRVESMVPILGPAAAGLGQQFDSGDVAGGLGSSLGTALNFAAPEFIKGANIPRSASEGLYKSALKPSTSLDAGQTARMVQTGLREGIPVTPNGIDTLSNLINDVNGAIKDQINAAGPNRTITGNRALANVQDARARFTNQVNPSADLSAIDASGQEFQGQLASKPAGSLTAQEAQAMKQGTYTQLKSRSYGELKSATVEAQKALARGLKDELNEQFPELQNLNARDSQLLQLEPVLERAVQRTSNHQLIGIGSPIAGLAGRAITGSSAGGLVAMAMKSILDNPGVKSHLAIALSRASGSTIPAAGARIVGYANALAHASVEGPDPDSADRLP